MPIMDFIRNNYLYMLIALAGGILIYAYIKADASTKRKIKKIFSGKVLFAVIFGGLWWIWYKTGDSVTISDANRWMPVILLVVVAGYNFFGLLRYQSQQIVCANGFHGSYSKPPRRINGFLIFAIDSFNAGGLSWDYAGRILVLREETTELCDEGAVSIARPTILNTGSYELDPEVSVFINNDRFFKGRKDVYYGWFDDLETLDYTYEQLAKLDGLKGEDKQIYELLKKEFGVSNPKISTLYWLYKNQCKSVNKQTEQYDSTVEAVEKGVEHNKRVKDAYVGKADYPSKMEGHEENY